jgi:hypothetical protein
VAVSVRVSVSVCLKKREEKKREEKEKKREEDFSSLSVCLSLAAPVFLPNCIVSSQHALGALPRIRV